MVRVTFPGACCISGISAISYYEIRGYERLYEEVVK